ncbi:site-specific recombinase XerD [Haloactinopolyspora alba]|uniref:Site-specific recombinase XerD n=1 Tax=Haloactinopolyspora alba TaxID=648780 RepID=A0A2P8DZ68_9ACTN|nr:site-specific integrase [Haloactinopolyspora alba]PSL02510.1 site-specific recombinase XerD [Haloactinopolyspora alba]
MATIEAYTTRAGEKRYRVRYRTPDRSQTDKRGFRTKRDAEAFAATVEVSKLRGEYVAPGLARVTVGEWCETWYAGKTRLKATTRERYRGLLDLHVLPTWRTVPIGDVTHADVVAWVAKVAAARTRDDGTAMVSQAGKALRVLSQALKLAVRDGRLSRNPCEGVEAPRTAGKPRRYLNAGQVEKLAQAAHDAGETPDPAARLTRRACALFLAYCGPRWGEMAALRVCDVDFLRRRVSIDRNVVEVDGGRLEWTTPKTHERRTVPIPRFLVDELAGVVEGRAPDDLLFPTPRGAVMRNRGARVRWFDRAVVAAGLPAGLTPHELRHTSASLAVSAGANVKSVQRMLGHKSAAMTLDVYADLFDDDLEAVADRLDEIAAKARTVTLDAGQSRQSVGKMWARRGSGESENRPQLAPVQVKGGSE